MLIQFKIVSISFLFKNNIYEMHRSFKVVGLWKICWKVLRFKVSDTKLLEINIIFLFYGFQKSFIPSFVMLCILVDYISASSSVTLTNWVPLFILAHLSYKYSSQSYSKCLAGKKSLLEEKLWPTCSNLSFNRVKQSKDQG